MKILVLSLIKLILLPFGMLASIFTGSRPGIRILMYHRVNDQVEKELSLRLDSFAWQMEYLKAGSYSVISMGTALEMIASGAITGNNIVLTFDDGYEDFYTNAYPILKKHGFHSTIYIVPGFIETGNIFWWDKDIKESSLMNWRQIIELSESGLVTIGSHTNSHTDLNRLDEEGIRKELLQSRAVIEEKTKQPVRHFSYPRGILTDTALDVVRELYSTGVLLSNGIDAIKGSMGDQLYKLRRVPVQRSDGRYFFVARLKGWLFLEEMLRRLKTACTAWVNVV